MILTNIFTPGTDVYRNDFGRNDNIDGRFDYKMSDMSNGTDANGEFALTFRSRLNEEYTTKTMNAYNLTEEEVCRGTFYAVTHTSFSSFLAKILSPLVFRAIGGSSSRGTTQQGH